MQSFQTADAQGAFTFDIHARRVRISDAELLKGLRRYAAVHGQRPFRCQDFRKWRERPFEPNTAARRFGSWRKALARIGIYGVRATEYEPEELITNLENVWREMGRPPGCTQLSRRGICGAQVYKRRWGSVRRACELLAAHHRGEMTREDLLRARPGPGKRPRRAISVELRWRILTRDKFRCGACGKSPKGNARVELEVDHIVPVAKGGGNEEGNLRTLCWACNRGKGANRAMVGS